MSAGTTQSLSARPTSMVAAGELESGRLRSVRRKAESESRGTVPAFH